MRFAGLQDFISDLRFAIRRLRRAPGFAAVVVISLALGLALAASTLAFVNAYLLRALPFAHGERLYHVRYAPPGPYEPRGMTALDWSSVSDVVETAIVSAGETYYLTGHGPTQRVNGRRVSAGFISGLGVRPVHGRVFRPEEFAPGGERVAVIGHALWRDRFGADPQIVGRQIPAHTEPHAPDEPLRIIGVLPPGFWHGRDSTALIDVLVPLRQPARAYMVKLQPGVPVAFAEQRITQAARAVGSDFRPGWEGVKLDSVHGRYVTEVRPLLIGVTLATALVLVLVCANVAVLVLLRGMRRQKELAVRVALGAGRWHVGRMLAAESCLLCGAGLIAGTGLAVVTLRLVAPIIETHLGRPPPGGSAAIAVDPTVGLIVGAIGVLVALSLTFVPLLAPWQRRLADALRREGMSGTDGPFMRRLRAGLIAFEIAGALVLLVGCGLLLRSAFNLLRTDLGYKTERLVRARITLPTQPYTDAASLPQAYLKLLDRLSAETATPLALAASYPPFYDARQQPAEIDSAETPGLTVGVNTVGAGYLSVYDIETRQGRAFRAGDRLGSEPVAIVSETLARKLWPGRSALGQRIRVIEQAEPGAPLGPWRTVVGLVADVRQTYADDDLRDLYLPFLQSPSRFFAIHLRTDRSPAFWRATLTRLVGELEPYAAIGEVATIASYDRQLAGTRFMTGLLAAFAGFAALLATIGIYGVTAYAVQQREREIAIRIALGATGRVVVRLFLAEAGRVLAVGTIGGLLAAIAAGRILESRVFGVTTTDATTFIATAALMLTVGALATWWPARRAAAKDPIVALKAE